MNTERVVDSFPSWHGKLLRFPRKFVPARACASDAAGLRKREAWRLVAQVARDLLGLQIGAHNSFHEKAGVSQFCFIFLAAALFRLSLAAAVAILPSALFFERFSLGASWASSFQQVLRPDNRPRLPFLRRELGQDLVAVT